MKSLPIFLFGTTVKCWPRIGAQPLEWDLNPFTGGECAIAQLENLKLNEA